MKLQKLLLTLQLSVVAIATTPSLTQAALAPEGGVRLYTDPHCTSQTLQFPPNNTYNVTLKPEYQNQISSIEVPTGFTVTLIDTDTTTPQSQTFNAGTHPSIGEAMDNKADIVIVSRVELAFVYR